MDVLVVVVIALIVAGVALALRARRPARPAPPAVTSAPPAFDLAPLEGPYRERIDRLVRETPPTDENLALLDRAYRAAREASALLAHERRAQGHPEGAGPRESAREMREHRHELDREIDAIELELSRLTRMAREGGT